MKRLLLLLYMSLLGSPAVALNSPPPHWSRSQANRLIEWLNAAANDGLGSVTSKAKIVQAAVDDDDETAVDVAATAAAVQLLDAYRRGCCNASLRTGWHIAETNAWSDPASTVA